MPTKPAKPRHGRQQRRGIVVVLTGFLLVGIFAFVALSVDTGRMVLTEAEMQNAVDAAALAAAQEIQSAIRTAGQNQTSANLSAGSPIIADARNVAADVAAANGVFVDAAKDVMFGSRRYDPSTETWVIEWDAEPINAVRVDARRTGSDVEAPDGELPLAFGWAVGRESVPLQTSATSFIEARDMVLVLDFSSSMRNDTWLRGTNNLSQETIEASIDNCYQELLDSGLTWVDQPDRQKWLTAYGKIDSPLGTQINSGNTNTIYNQLDLGEKYPNNHPQWPGQLKYPFPQSGRDSTGAPRPMLNESQNRSRWRSYINYVRNLNGKYRRRYGYRTLLDYLYQNNQINWDESEDLWRTSHYPFHAVKNGASLFLDFLDDLNFEDEVGLVSYGGYAEVEDSHYDGEVDIDISDNPITSDYASIDTIQRRHQAGHYDVFTGTGDGLLHARELLVGEDGLSGHARPGSTKTIILMTDGEVNRANSGWSLPAGFSWADYTDYDGDGTADYTTSDTKKKYVFYETIQAVNQGITIHTVAVGGGADRDLMRAVAHAGGGVFISVPGGARIEDIEDQLREAFGEIAAKVPPPSLVFDINSDAGGAN